jgi:hypothetical protein
VSDLSERFASLSRQEGKHRRELRLLLVAMARRAALAWTGGDGYWGALRLALSAAVANADGRLGDDKLTEHRARLRALKIKHPAGRSVAQVVSYALARQVPRSLALFVTGLAAYAYAEARLARTNRDPEEESERFERLADEEQREHALLFDDIIAPAIMSPRDDRGLWRRQPWNNAQPLQMAQVIYAEGRFEDCPILADALEDAGCADNMLTTHLRSTLLRHAHGCWAVDLVLGFPRRVWPWRRRVTYVDGPGGQRRRLLSPGP